MLQIFMDRFGTFGPDPQGAVDLRTKILNFLNMNNIELNSSMQAILRHIISTEAAVYETRLQKAEETIFGTRETV
jgi:hypothetical protein